MEGGPNLNIKVGQTGLSKADLPERRFRAASRDYWLRHEIITPYTPKQNGIVERFFAA
jgi:hypothetical protein